MSKKLIIVVLAFLTMPSYAVQNFKISEYGAGVQIWFEVEHFDERNPADESVFALSDEPGAFGRSINSLDPPENGSGYIRYTFDISKAGGTGGTWYFWGRVINPRNNSDFMLVEGHPGDQIPFTMPTGSLDNSQRIFEQGGLPSEWVWAPPPGSRFEEAHTKTLKDGENTMYILNREEGAIWDVFMWSNDDGYVPTDDDYLNALPGKPTGKALRPNPVDGAVVTSTWVSCSWLPGGFAVSHDVYMGEDFDDVNTANVDSPLFRVNVASNKNNFLAGFPGYPYPDGLVPGTMYYWRVDAINEAEPNSPWKGDVWSFWIPPTNAYDPSPSDGAESVDLDVTLSWQSGLGAKSHNIVFGDHFEDVHSATEGVIQGNATFTPAGPLEPAKTYYWRVDEFDPPTTSKGHVWSFTTEGTATDPYPAKGAVDVSPTPLLKWAAADLAASHDVYFGTDADAVKVAGKTSPEFKGTRELGDETYDVGKLDLRTTYYWRVDEVNDTEPGSPWIGNVWSFTTGDFLVVDDFESYNDIDPPDEASNRIFDKWIDGYANPLINGALVGNLLPPYAEQVIVHSGSQSMNYAYDNAGKTSEATLTLVYPRDWTEEGVAKLSLWHKGASANAPHRLFVALNDTAVVYHDDPAATNITGWKQWVIDLQSFAGVNLTNVNAITIGVGTKGAPAPAGGTGTMYFDDIRLIR